LIELKTTKKPPRDNCLLCGAPLRGRDRYKVKLYLKIEPFKKIVYKRLIVCDNCLRELLNNTELKKRFRIKYRKMRPLKQYP